MADSLNFHGTFPPTPAYIGRILKVADGEEKTIEEISELTGIPQGKSSGKVEPHIAYAEYMGLLDRDTFSKTRLGKIVLREDSVLSEKLTQLICHSMITSVSGAEMWHFFFRKLMPENKNGITRSSLTEIMSQQFGNTRFAPVISMYTKQFVKLKILEDDGETVKISPIPVERDMIYAYGLALLHEWEKSFSDDIEITATQLETLKFGAVYGWDSDMEYEVLLRLCDKGIIGMNNQLVPFTVKKLVTADALIPKLYSLLF